jgi:hypothetical protein
MSTAGARGGASAAGEKQLEDHVEMQQDSTSKVSMLAARGTFIASTADGTNTEARHSTKRHRAAEHLSEDLLNRHIKIMGWSLPNGPKILCGVSSRNTVPRSSRVKMTISSWHSKPSARSAWRTSSDVGIAQSNWATTIHRLQ